MYGTFIQEGLNWIPNCQSESNGADPYSREQGLGAKEKYFVLG